MKTTQIKKYFSIGLLGLLLIQTSEARALQIGDIERDTEGRALKLRQDEAEEHCQKLGSRLPTAREFALYTQSLGARGILETAYKGVDFTNAKVKAEANRMVEAGYYEIYTKNSDGKTVIDFYYNPTGYQRPEKEANFVFRTSSLHPYPVMGDYVAYIMYNLGGLILPADNAFPHFYENYEKHLVRCVKFSAKSANP